MLNDHFEVNEYGIIQDVSELEIRMRGGLGRKSLIKSIFNWSKDIELNQVKYTSVNLFNATSITKVSFTLDYLCRKSEVIRDAVDSHMFSVIINDLKGFRYGKVDNPIKLTDKSVIEYLINFHVFTKALTGSNSLVLVVPPKVKKMLLNNFKNFEICNKNISSPIQNGYIGRVLGIEVYCTTNLFERNNTTCILAMSKDFMEYSDTVQVLGQQYDPETNLTSIVAKYQYGYRVKNPHGCVTMFVET
jgi:hypothetical protein